MRLLVTGARGQVGTELVALARADPSLDVVAATRDDLDLADLDSIPGILARAAPDVVVNCAAYNAVDAAEDDPETAMRVNGEAPGVLARACAEQGAHLVHISTDYVFDGEKRTPYEEGDEPTPRSAYGRSKLAGERAVSRVGGPHALVRTAWVFGRVGRSLVELIVRRAAAGHELRMVDDQRGSPTCARDLAGALLRLAAEGATGTVHVTNAGSCTPYELALDVVDVAGLHDATIERVTTEELARPAPRPAYSVLASTRLSSLGLEPLRHYRDALAELVPGMLVSQRDGD